MSPFRVVFLTLTLVPSLLAQAAPDLSGDWTVTRRLYDQDVDTARMTLRVEGSRITGTLNELHLEGALKDGNQLHLDAKRPNGKSFGPIDGTIEDADHISGTVSGNGRDFQWSARRLPRIASAPQTRTFDPTEFHRQFSGSIAPALHINPGDTIITTTVDAGGADSHDKRRSLGGNPETGPFYIEGAVPGDTLVIHFTRIRLNRDYAVSGDRIVSSALDPDYFREAKFDENFNSRWRLDIAAGTASLAQPTDHLKNFHLNVRPMLGCVGVAPPAKQAFRTGWLGPFGGNMDYSGLREGVTLYLPVFQEGAILFVGDGHALEGDGELTGDALETSMDVQFTVGLIRGQSIDGPRFEDADYLMASGIANSLPEALQQATTELSKWLEHDYKLTPNEAHMVLGTSIRYDVAEVVDPQVHIVTKVNKSILATLK